MHWLPVKYRIIFKVLHGHLQSTARVGSKLLEDSATKLHSVSLTEIRDRKFTDHAESTPRIRMPKFRGGGPQVVE